MADYHPLILRAVEGLEKNTGENRRALYERARIALVAQLRGVQPALDESEITRERLALEEAIRKVEAESARKAREEPRPAPPPRQPAPRMERPTPRPAAPPPAPPPPAPEQHAPEPYTPPPPPPPPPPPRERAPLTGNQPSLSDQALKGFREVVPNEAPPRPEAPRPAPPRPEVPRPSEYRRPERPIERPAPRPAAPPPPPPPPPPPAQPDPLREYGQLEPDVKPENLWDNAPPPPVDFDAGRPPLPPGRPRPQAYEPEEPEEPPRRSARAPGAYAGLFKIVAIFAAIGIVGALAFWQRGAIMNAAGSVVAMVRGTGSTQAPKPASDPNARPKIADRLGQPQQAGPAVAQRVVLYEEDPDDPQGKRSLGSVIWRTETTQAAPGRPADLMVKADIEVPDRRMTVTWSLRRNTDASLPASHTIEIMFNMPPDSPAGGVQNVPGVLMKQAESTRGVPLSGLAVKVTPGFFLIGLSATEADMQRNLQLLKERSWFDIPVVYNNNRRAILAVEKGTPGERAFAEAFAAWKQ